MSGKKKKRFACFACSCRFDLIESPAGSDVTPGQPGVVASSYRPMPDLLAMGADEPYSVICPKCGAMLVAIVAERDAQLGTLKERTAAHGKA